eukprot:1155149-Pelagomonas_calceolata.AAC.2
MDHIPWSTHYGGLYSIQLVAENWAYPACAGLNNEDNDCLDMMSTERQGHGYGVRKSCSRLTGYWILDVSLFL